MTGAELIAAAIQLGPLLIQAGEAIEPFAEDVYLAVTRAGGPTAADWDALHAREDALREVLQAALDPGSTA